MAVAMQLHSRQRWPLAAVGACALLAGVPVGDGLGSADVEGGTSKPAAPCCAFATLAVDGADPQGVGALWQVLPLAQVMRRFHSQYPLLVLTNATRFEDGVDVKEALSKLGAQVVPVHKVPIPANLQRSFRYPYWSIAWWKLQIWRLTEYKRVIWFDSDSILTRSIDWLFHYEPTHMMPDAWACDKAARGSYTMTDKQMVPCSGLMLIEPSEETYQGLLDYANRLPSLPQADQALIVGYFNKVVERPILLLRHQDAAFGHCLHHVAGVNESDIVGRWGFGSPWRLPAFVHKSSVGNECFSHQFNKQLRWVEGVRRNICHFHPLGSYWRDAFCKAVEFIGTSTRQTDTFCDDKVWYHDHSLDPNTPAPKKSLVVKFRNAGSSVLTLLHKREGSEEVYGTLDPGKSLRLNGRRPGEVWVARCAGGGKQTVTVTDTGGSRLEVPLAPDGCVHAEL